MSSARKMKLKLAQRKPRNPLVMLAARRKAGSHRPSTKAQRQQEKKDMQKSLRGSC